jgi:thiosulfate reductase cytochrome b subunit
MSNSTQRVVLRWIHIVGSIPIVGYVYSPFKNLPDYAPVVRFISIPVLVLTGLWMWKGHVLQRVISKKPAYNGPQKG